MALIDIVKRTPQLKPLIYILKGKKIKAHEEGRVPHPFTPHLSISTRLEALLPWTASAKIRFNNLSKYP